MNICLGLPGVPGVTSSAQDGLRGHRRVLRPWKLALGELGELLLCESRRHQASKVGSFGRSIDATDMQRYYNVIHYRTVNLQDPWPQKIVFFDWIRTHEKTPKPVKCAWNPNFFPASRLCRNAHILQLERPSDLYLSLLQPTKRGTWMRGERRRFYQPGGVWDRWLFVVLLDWRRWLLPNVSERILLDLSS